jgi:hypothetical protein
MHSGRLYALDQDGIELAKTSQRLTALTEELFVAAGRDCSPIGDNSTAQQQQQLFQCCHENFGNLLNFTEGS